MAETHRAKRPRLGESAVEPQSPSSAEATDESEQLRLNLLVRWHSGTGNTKISNLTLRQIDGIDSLKGLSKGLVSRAFAVSGSPTYITSQEFVKYTPEEDFLTLPGDIARTEFRLVVTHDGWEYTVLKRDLEAGQPTDGNRNMLVTAIEFESTALMMGNLGLRMAMISYPVVAISQEFITDLRRRLRSEDFKGLM